MRRRLGLATLLLVLFLTFMDNTVISVTLANVQSTLYRHQPAAVVINGYALVFASLMLLFGTLGDQLGRKKVMLSGVILFCCGSVVAALAQNADTLIAGRVIMGLGAAASEPGTLSMIRHMYPERRSGEGARDMGWCVGPCARNGPLDRWRPRGRLLVPGSLLVQPVLRLGRAHRRGADTAREPQQDSVPPGLRGLPSRSRCPRSCLLCHHPGRIGGYRNSRIDLLFAAALLLAIFFVFYERTVAHPILDVSFFKRSAFAGCNVVAFCTYFGTSRSSSSWLFISRTWGRARATEPLSTSRRWPRR